MTEYELWLDESGDFQGEKVKKERGLNPSLIGGILIRKENINQIPFEKLIDPTRYHATELQEEDKVTYILPILEKLREEYHAREVFFENTTYADSESNRTLYLMMMAEGLTQLMLNLNAVEEDVTLNVLIARRQDATASYENRIITDNEYIRALEKCIEKKRKSHRLLLSDSSTLAFDINIANRTNKLRLADFACNTRLTRSTEVFRNEKDRLNAIYDDSLIFKMSELTSENNIKRCLTQGMISDALIELYTTLDKIDKTKNLDLIFEKISKSSYRLVKSQIKQFETDIISYVSLEDDYEVGESLIKEISETLFSRLDKLGSNFIETEIRIMLYLADMYLREGDIVSAAEVLDDCENKEKNIRSILENLLLIYQIREKRALYYIDSFQYQKAFHLMDRSVSNFECMTKSAEKNMVGLPETFARCDSEFLGDALCMQIYAAMFLQRIREIDYDTLVMLSDYALGQYPNHEAELERHRQYRSHIELEEGHYEQALKVLIQAKSYQLKDLTQNNIKAFLDDVTDTEINISCQYYLMYYLLIMDRAKSANDELADKMYECLLKQKRLIDEVELHISEEDDSFENEIDLKKIKEKKRGIIYHPMEINYWKYGSYLRKAGSLKSAALYLKKAESLCYRYDDYQTMIITGLGITAELIEVYNQLNEQTYKNTKVKILDDKISKILAQELDDDTRVFVEKISEAIKEKKYLVAAEMITY